MSTLAIPGVETVHPRASWQDPRYPIVGPAMLWDELNQGVAHYPGVDEVPSGDIHEHADHVPRFLRAAQVAYHFQRGYSLGYLWAIDWLGGAWEIRGFDIRAAANPGRLHNPNNRPELNANRWTAPFLFIVDIGERITPEAAATGRALWREYARLAPRPWLPRPRPHHYWDATGCPGAVIDDINAGLLDIDYVEAPTAPLPPTAPPEDPDVPRSLIRASNSNAVFDTDGQTKTWVLDPEALDVKRLLFSERGWNPDPVVIDPRHVAGFGPVLGPIPPGHDAWGRKA